MPPLLRFLLRRLFFALATLAIISLTLFAIIQLAPLESRARLYFPPRTRADLSPEIEQRMIQAIIRDHGMDQPLPVQYAHWVARLVRGEWGWSPVLNVDVLQALWERTPVTAELTLYSVLLLIPLGLVSGVLAGWQRNRAFDSTFRLAAFIATSTPPFILGLVLLSVFYVGLRWFPPGRTGITELMRVSDRSFQSITGLLTIDGLLNRRLDVTLDAARHLVLPVFTLSLMHWATLGRVTRAAMVEELGKEYITAARARGVPAGRVLWGHALRNAIGPGLTSAALSAASLVTGVYIVEVIFTFPGVSRLVISAMGPTPDTPLALGFAVYSSLMVLPLMLALDLLQAAVDPRLREQVIEG